MVREKTACVRIGFQREEGEMSAILSHKVAHVGFHCRRHSNVTWAVFGVCAVRLNFDLP